ncbi:hypothetical protein ACSMFR_05345 [Listeria aquatica]|uniref:hypothetical protein n=1 Tax=Listeria aquatica TaxID=1494960 RepID=UPI001FD23ACF|nr:hypothetical protein [Listeria aquatica]
MNLQSKILAGDKVKLYVNKRLIFSNVLLSLAASILLYLLFSHLKGVTGTEEIILLVFLAMFVLRPFFRLLNVMPTLELSQAGIGYRGDFEPWDAVFDVKVVRPKVRLFSFGRLMLYTKIKGEPELAWDITAYDSELDLLELEALIKFCIAEFGENAESLAPVLEEKQPASF